MKFNIKPTAQLLRERNLQKGGEVQKYIDNECKRCMAPYTPKMDGNLIKSADFGTVVGSGIIKQSIPYARRNYYGNRGFGKQGTARGGLRGRKWFERMKAAHKDKILDGARKISGARRR